MVVSILNNFAIIKKHKERSKQFFKQFKCDNFLTKVLTTLTNFLYDLNKLILD
jgi:hypothetical protein